MMAVPPINLPFRVLGMVCLQPVALSQYGRRRPEIPCWVSMTCCDVVSTWKDGRTTVSKQCHDLWMAMERQMPLHQSCVGWWWVSRMFTCQSVNARTEPVMYLSPSQTGTGMSQVTFLWPTPPRDPYLRTHMGSQTHAHHYIPHT